MRIHSCQSPPGAVNRTHPHTPTVQRQDLEGFDEGAGEGDGAGEGAGGEGTGKAAAASSQSRPESHLPGQPAAVRLRLQLEETCQEPAHC